jgi:CHAT domain-containing protein
MVICVALVCPVTPLAHSTPQILARADQLAWRGNWVKAGLLYEQAERELKQSGDKKGCQSATVGRIRSQMQHGSCSTLLEQINRELTNPLFETDTELKIRALAYKGEIAHQCDLWVAREAWEQVLDLARETGNKNWEGRALGELGVLAYVSDGDSTRATLLVGKALFKVAETRDSWGGATYLTHSANSLSLIGRHEVALKFSDKALTAARTNPDSPFPVAVYIGRARTLLEMGKHSQAQELVAKALQQARTMNYRISEAEILILSARLAIKRNDSKMALENLIQAERIAERGEYGRALAEVESELAILLKKNGDLEAAGTHLSRGIDTMKRIGDSCNLPQRLKDLATLKASRGDFMGANAVYDEITDLTEGMIASSNTEYAKASLIGALSDVFVNHFTLLADRLRDTRKAFQILERARGRSISDRLRIGAPPDEEALQAKRPIYRELSELNRQLMQSADPAARAELLLKINASEQRFGPVIAEHNLYQKGIRGRAVPLDQIQQALNNHELLLEYVLSEPTSYCVAITRDAINLVRLASRTQINSAADRFLKGVRSKNSAVEARTKLFNLLLASVGTTQFSRLIIVPDGNLHLLPFDSFVNEQGQSLIEAHVVSYAPSATSFYLLRTLPSPNGERKPLLAVGGISANQRPRPPKHFAKRSLFTLEAKRIEDLTQTSVEINAISQLFPDDAVVLEGRRATESALKSQPLEKFQFVHFALHGFSDMKIPERTALLLAGEEDSPEDGLLQDREIRDMRLSADLVTLSACDTGIGRLQGQEGISSMVGSFLLAGARSVVASLWQVDDRSTSVLMKRFYSYLAKGKARANALRLAKLDFIRQYKQDALPYFWAGFTLHGDSLSGAEEPGH